MKSFIGWDDIASETCAISRGERHALCTRLRTGRPVQETAQAGPTTRRPFIAGLSCALHPGAPDLVVVAAEHDADDVLADVVHVALDGRDHKHALMRNLHVAFRNAAALLPCNSLSIDAEGRASTVDRTYLPAPRARSARLQSPSEVRRELLHTEY